MNYKESSRLRDSIANIYVEVCQDLVLELFSFTEVFSKESNKLLKKWSKSLRVVNVTSYGWPSNKMKYSKI